MDNVDRMYRHLVRTIRTKFPQYLDQPFDVGELQSTIIPYRLHRRELGLETNEDYEITLTELLSGTRDYLIVDDLMKSALGKELAATNPDPSAFKQFSTAKVALSPSALRSLAAGPDDLSTPLRTIAVPVNAPMHSEPTSVPPGQAATPDAHAMLPTEPIPRQSMSQPQAAKPADAPRVSGASVPTTTPAGARAITPQAGERCRSCNEALPPGRPITFCPHCGNNVTTIHCPACGSELEVGWKFCPVCGRPADAH